MRHVLVIDDDAVTREVLRLALEAVGGHTVTDAGSGRTGASLARERVPDAVLLDMVMPGEDGPATLALLRGQPETREVPVVFLTGLDSPDAALGAAGALRKPFDPMTLSDELARLLGWA